MSPLSHASDGLTWRITTVIDAAELAGLVTRWVEESEGGRARGPRGLVRAWVEVLARPARFFQTGVAPGDQAPGLVFAVSVAVVYAAVRLAVEPAGRPTVFGGEVLSSVVLLGAVGLLVAPAVLHLTAAFQTVAVLVAATTVGQTGDGWQIRRLDHAGVSETVQVLAYASAPGVFAAVPFAPLRLAAAAYGVVLVVYGTTSVHELPPVRALIAGVPPGVALFGYGFGGLAALRTLLG